MIDHRVAATDDRRQVGLVRQAAAYAEAGDFAKAVELQTLVLKNKPKASFAKQQLALYEQLKPWHKEYLKGKPN